MKIVYTYMYFNTPKGKWSTRVYDFTKEWIKKDNEVHVITAKYYKSDINSNKLYKKLVIDDIIVHFINVEINNKHNFPRRIFNFIRFTLLSLIIQIKIKSDIYIYSSGPITVFLNAFFLKIFFRKKFFVEVRDLWPEVLKELKIINDNIIYKVLLMFVSYIYKKSDGIIVLSNGMKKYLILNYDLNKNKIHVATNSANFDLINSISNSNKFIKYKYIIYFGNLGDVNCTKEIIEIFKIYSKKYNSKVKFVIVGGGQHEEHVINEARHNKNIIFLKSVDKKQLIPLIKNAKLSVLPLRSGLIINTSSPNKFFESIACGTPVFQSTNGWIKDLIDKNKLGFNFDIDNCEEAAFLLNLALEKINKDYVKSCLHFSKQNFDKKQISINYLTFLNENTILPSAN